MRAFNLAEAGLNSALHDSKNTCNTAYNITLQYLDYTKLQFLIEGRVFLNWELHLTKEMSVWLCVADNIIAWMPSFQPP